VFGFGSVISSREESGARVSVLSVCAAAVVHVGTMLCLRRRSFVAFTWSG